MRRSKPRAVLVGDAQGVGEAAGDDQDGGLALALEQGVGGHRGTEPDLADPVRGDLVGRAEAEQLADAGHRGVAVLAGLSESSLWATAAVGPPGHDVGERAAPVDPEFPAPVHAVLAPDPGSPSAPAAQPWPYPVAGSSSRYAACTSSAVTVVRSSAVACCSPQAHHPDVPAGAGPLGQGPRETAVAELVDPPAAQARARDARQHLLGAGSNTSPAPGQQHGDPDQIVGLVAGEADPGADREPRPGLLRRNRSMSLVLPGQHDDQPVAVVASAGFSSVGPPRRRTSVTAGYPGCAARRPRR